MRPVHTATCSATSLASFSHRWRCVCPVNNSAFTLAIAAESIAAAGRVLQLLGTPPDPAHGNWSALSNRSRLNIPFNTTLRYHPEFEGYAQGTTINQADTQFMQYPLQFPMPADVAANDMSLYDQALANHGPSMTWPFFAASYLQKNLSAIVHLPIVDLNASSASHVIAIERGGNGTSVEAYAERADRRRAELELVSVI